MSENGEIPRGIPVLLADMLELCSNAKKSLRSPVYGWDMRSHGSHWEVEDPLSSINVEEHREVRIECEPGMKGEILKRSITKE